MLIVHTELRDNVYEYVGPAIEPVERASFQVKHKPWPDADKFSGLILVCRQIYEEFHARNPHSKPLSKHITLSLTDVGDYARTFFRSAKEVEKIEQVTITEFTGWYPFKDMITPMINIIPLLRWEYNGPMPKLYFRTMDLSELATIIQSHPVHESSTSKETAPLHGSSHVKGDPTPEEISAFVRAIDDIWVRRDQLLFLFNPRHAASWMNTEYLMIYNIYSRISDIDNGEIPENYFSEDMKQCIRFWKCMGLGEMSRSWKVGLGISGRHYVGSPQIERQDTGWVWSNEEGADNQVDDESDEEEEYYSDQDPYGSVVSSVDLELERDPNYHPALEMEDDMIPDLDDDAAAEEEALEYADAEELECSDEEELEYLEVVDLLTAL